MMRMDLQPETVALEEPVDLTPRLVPRLISVTRC